MTRPSVRAFASALALAAAPLAGPAGAEPFTVLLYETPEDLARRAADTPEGQAYWAAWGDYAATLEAAGAVRGGSPLRPIDPASVQGAALARADGLQVSGLLLLEVPDQAAADALAALAPAVARGGSAEARPHLAVPGGRLMAAY